MKISMKKRNIIIIISVAALLLAAIIWALVYYFAVKLPDVRKREEELRKYNEFYASELERFASENELYEDYEVDVAFIGDSLTAGCDIARYYPEYLALNRGIGGDTTHGLEDRLAVSVLDLVPKVCVMLIGGNNMDTMFENYEDILIAFKENIPDTKIILVSHAPTSQSITDRNKTFTYNNVKVKLLAEKYGYEFVDIYTPLFDLEAGEMKAEYTTDGAHFTHEAYEIVSGLIKSAIDKVLVK